MENIGYLGLVSTVGTVWFIIDWIIRIVALFVVPRNRKPTAGMAWLLFIFLVPILGMFVFLILGNPKLPKSRQNAQKTVNKLIASMVKSFQKNKQLEELLKADVPEKYQKVAQLNQSLSGMPVVKGNKLKILPEYDKVFDNIIKDIDSAKQFVHMEYFIIALDDTTVPVFDAVARAVERGVSVRVMYDWLSIVRYPRYKEVKKLFESYGAIVQPILPLRFPGKGYVRPDLRNHRKLVVIDGKIGYTGSQNLIQRNYHRKDDIYYDEVVVRVEGPVALELNAVFLSDWFAETGQLLSTGKAISLAKDLITSGSSMMQILPSGPGFEYENNLKAFTSLIHQARKKVIIVNPYFVPDDALTNAIISATKRNVEVIILNSESMDQWMVGHAQRSFYEQFLTAGIKIFLYDAPILLHTKFMVVDDEVVTVGSSNMDIRSFVLNLEVTLFCYDKNIAKDFNKVVDKYLSRSSEVKIKEWSQRTKPQKLLDNLARLTSALQ